MSSGEAVAEIASSVAKRGAESVRCTEAERPKESTLALTMFADGAKWSDIRKATGISYSILSRMRREHCGAIESARELSSNEYWELADTYREALKRKAEMLLDDDDQLKKANPKDLALATGIMDDKSRHNREGNTVKISHEVSLEDARKAIEEAMKRVKGEAIDV